MENNSIQALREQYFLAILQLQDEKDIINALPQPTYKNFFPIMGGLIQSIDHEITQTKELLISEEKGCEMYEYIKEDLRILLLKKELCGKLLLEAKETIATEELSQAISAKHLIFATTDSGNIYLERDIKDMKPEFYDRIGEMLELLESRETPDNIKPLINNTKLVGIWEIKEFQTRVIFKNLSPDTIYVMMARIKKDDNSSIDREEVIIRNQQLTKEYNRLKQEIKDPVKKEALILRNKTIQDSLFQYLNEHKRG